MRYGLDILKGVLIVLLVMCTSFFLLFAFHATTPEQAHAKHYLDGFTDDTPFSGDEQTHMVDVRELLDRARIFALIVIIAGLVAFEKRTRFSTVFAATVLITLPVLLALIPWNTVFTEFHHIFFPQGNWMFAYTSEIIQTYPQSLFMTFAAAWGTMCLLSGIILMTLRGKW